MGRHDKGFPFQFAPEKGSRKMDRVQSPERNRKGLCRPFEYLSSGLDEIDGLQKPVDGLYARDHLVGRYAAGQAQPINRPEAFDLEKQT